MAGHTFILGGARSGKSLVAENFSLNVSSKAAYVATAVPGDKQMTRRIDKHRARRNQNFLTVEEPLLLADTLQRLAHTHDVILVDCLTLWLTNLMLSNNVDIEMEAGRLIQTLNDISECVIVLVSNEVGHGIVPDNQLAREFCDLAGELHQQVAEVSENVFFVTAGLPMVLKGKLPRSNQN